MGPLIILHGAPGDGRIWRPVIDRLPTEMQALTPTLSYFGGATWPDNGESFGTERHAAEIVAAAAQSAAPVRLVAWSFSVVPSLLAVLRKPELFSALLVYEPGLPTWVEDEGEMRRFGADAALAFGPIAEAVAQGDLSLAVARLFDASGGAGCFASLSSERQKLYLESASMMPLLMGGGLPPTPITPGDLASLEVPLEVAMGATTRPVFEVPTRALSRLVNGREPVIVPEANHMLPEVEPARFAGLIKNWIAGN